jgi:hypothetical protein
LHFRINQEWKVSQAVLAPHRHNSSVFGERKFGWVFYAVCLWTLVFTQRIVDAFKPIAECFETGGGCFGIIQKVERYVSSDEAQMLRIALAPEDQADCVPFDKGQPTVYKFLGMWNPRKYWRQAVGSAIRQYSSLMLFCE